MVSPLASLDDQVAPHLCGSHLVTGLPENHFWNPGKRLSWMGPSLERVLQGFLMNWLWDGGRLGVALWRWPLFPNHFFEAKWSESWCSSGKAHYVVQIKPWTWRWGKRKNNEYRGTGRICNVPEVPGCLDAKNRLIFSWVIRENVFCLCLSAFSWRVSMLLQWQNTKRKINVH